MISQTTLVGTLGQVPEYTPGDKDRCRLRIATHETYIQDGEEKKVTDWHNIIVWGPRAKNLLSLQVGDQIVVVGRYVTRQYENKDGETKRITEVVARAIGRTL